MMKSCSFSVVQSIRHVAESDESVAMVSLPRIERASMASTILDRLEGFPSVLRPLSWSEMRERSSSLAERDGVERIEKGIRVLGRWGLGFWRGGEEENGEKAGGRDDMAVMDMVGFGKRWGRFELVKDKYIENIEEFYMKAPIFYIFLKHY